MTSITIPGGLLVAIEGIDGAGKSTLARGLAQRLTERGVAVSSSKEPTTGPYGAVLRQSADVGRLTPEQEVHLLLMDRREHVRDVIEPGLASGEVVILDRYFPSMVAYQGAAGLPVDQLLEANSFAPRPHLLILLDIDPTVGLGRIFSRGDKPNHFENVENLEKCRQIFLAMPAQKKFVIDASRSESDVLEECYFLLIRAASERMVSKDIDAAVSGTQALQAMMAGSLT